MQFVRHQGLSAAMWRLQAGDWRDSVTRIARDYGDRHISNFSTDVLWEFGVSPSAVLRAWRLRKSWGSWRLGQSAGRGKQAHACSWRSRAAVRRPVGVML
jgi:AraC-like DNA-binding protein